MAGGYFPRPIHNPELFRLYSALIITIFPILGIITAWLRLFITVKNKRVTSTVQVSYPPIRWARFFLLVACPIYAIALIFDTLNLAFLSKIPAGTAGNEVEVNAKYMKITADFLNAVAATSITTALALVAAAAFYITLGRTLAWTFVKFTTVIVPIPLFIFALARFGRRIAIMMQKDIFLRWHDIDALFALAMIVDVTLLAFTLGASGLSCYSIIKISRRNGKQGGGKGLAAVARSALGKTPILILVASILWITRCSYAIANTIITEPTEGQYDSDDMYDARYNLHYNYNNPDEQNIHLILSPILTHWIGALVLLLLVDFVRNAAVWSESDGSSSIHLQPAGAVSVEEREKRQ